MSDHDIEEMGVYMEPRIWGGLPEELLFVVCARLPVSQICQLRLLSKDWKRAIDMRSSFFVRDYLDQTVYPNMFSLISPVIDREGFSGPYSGRIFDVKWDRWHDFVLDSSVTRGMRLVGAADGGLVCLVNERTDESPLLITVLNPLTRKSVKLPCLLGIVDGVRPSDKPMMIQICMDSEKQHYIVLVVGHTPSPQVYSSKTKRWTVVGAEQQSWDRIFGYDYRWRLDNDHDPSLPDYKPLILDTTVLHVRMTLWKDVYKVWVVGASSEDLLRSVMHFRRTVSLGCTCARHVQVLQIWF